MSTVPVVVLVGPPGAGKSTVGALLARRLGTTYRDTDDDIVAAQGRSIAGIFATEGEPYFRELERRAVRAAVAGHPGVLALGGGAVLDPGTRALLAGLPVVFLDAPAADAVRRLCSEDGHGRPLLAGDVNRRWRALMERRRPLYAEVARVVVDVRERTPAETVDSVLTVLGLGPA